MEHKKCGNSKKVVDGTQKCDSVLFLGPRIWHLIFGGKPESDVLPLHPLPNEANAGARLCVMASERGRPGDDTVNWLQPACGAFQIHSQE